MPHFNQTHGHKAGGKRSPTYISWQAMIARCNYPGHPRYMDYGGRGVQIDPRWLGQGGFANFLEDLGERPSGLTLDRKDYNGHYTKENCRWATLQQQRWNRRTIKMPDGEPGPDVDPPPWHVEPKKEPVDDMPF